MNKIMFFSKHRIVSIFSISVFLLSILGQIGIHPSFAEVPGIFNLCGNMNIMAVKASGFSQHIFLKILLIIISQIDGQITV